MPASELMFAIEDEVGNGEKGAAKFAGGAAIEASFGAGGIVMGERARALERPRIAHQRGDLLRAQAVKTLFLEHGAHHATVTAPSLSSAKISGSVTLPSFRSLSTGFPSCK